MQTWKGFTPILVYDKAQEDKSVYSFYLRPFDGSSLPDYIPGQFIAIKFCTPDGGCSKARAYSLSAKPHEKYYRVSIKKAENGDVSALMCDTVKKGDVVQITAPSGKFVLKESAAPLVLIGGGIGITPMITMAASASNTGRPVHLIYSAQNSYRHAFKEEISRLVEKSDNIKLTTIYTRPLPDDKLGVNHDLEGRLTQDWVNNELPQDGEYYFCGPTPFMKSVYHFLKEKGIPREAVNFEVFEAGVDITAD
ncbi:MAG: FAD-binding oxidoreductase [Oscillospiraceae bacterium]